MGELAEQFGKMWAVALDTAAGVHDSDRSLVNLESEALAISNAIADLEQSAVVYGADTALRNLTIVRMCDIAEQWTRHYLALDLSDAVMNESALRVLSHVREVARTCRGPGPSVAQVMADDEVADLRRDLADAERRADELLAAISSTFQLEYKPISIHAIGAIQPHTSTAFRDDAAGLLFQVQAYGTPFNGFLVLYATAPAQPNPDLLERASLQLAEAYIKAKAEAEAVTVTP